MTNLPPAMSVLHVLFKGNPMGILGMPQNEVRMKYYLKVLIHEL